jgi:response regulator RpfG family c-di-GMP phosphodiesterase
VLKIFEEGAGTQFDPDVVEILFSCMEFIHFIQQRYPDKRTENL